MPTTIHRNSRKILMGALALALPLTSVALLESPALAKKPAPNPITCTDLAGTVNFAGSGLSKTGFTSSAKTALTTISGITLTCPGAGPTSGPTGLNVTVKNVKNPKVKGQPNTYTYGTFAIFFGSATAIKKSVKTVTFTINGNVVTFKNKFVAVDPGIECAGEVGFKLEGQVKTLPYNVATPGNNAEMLVCLGHDTGTNTTNSFIADLGNPASVITSAQIDPAESEAVL